MYFFLVAGNNPGFLDCTDTPESRKRKAQLFVTSDEFANINQTDEESNRISVVSSDSTSSNSVHNYNEP